MNQFVGTGPGRIPAPKNYREVLRDEGVALPLSDTNTPAYELFHPAGVIYCRKGIDNVLKLANIIRENATDIQNGDLASILDLLTTRASLETRNRPMFTKRNQTSADAHPEKWISLRQMLEAIGVDVEQLISKPTFSQMMSKLAATGNFESDLDELEPPKEVISPCEPYGFGPKR